MAFLIAFNQAGPILYCLLTDILARRISSSPGRRTENRSLVGLGRCCSQLCIIGQLNQIQTLSACFTLHHLFAWQTPLYWENYTPLTVCIIHLYTGKFTKAIQALLNGTAAAFHLGFSVQLPSY